MLCCLHAEFPHSKSNLLYEWYFSTQYGVTAMENLEICIMNIVIYIYYVSILV